MTERGRRVGFFEVLSRDFERNGQRLGVRSFLRGLLVPNRFGALTWLRLYQRFESRRLPRALAYRMLIHVHGLEMDEQVRIGPGLFLPHPRGVLFAAGTRIGADCSVYGMVRFLANDRGTPVVEDGVFLGDGARILGRVVVGRGCQVGAGAVVTKDLPPGVSAAGVPARVLRRAPEVRGVEPHRASGDGGNGAHRKTWS